MLIFVRALSGAVTSLNVNPYETVLSVKHRLLHLKGIAVSQQHLLYDDLELPDATILVFAKIGHGALLRLVLGLHSGPLSREVTTLLNSDSQNKHVQSCHKSPPSLYSSTSNAVAFNRSPTTVIPLACVAALQQQQRGRMNVSNQPISCVRLRPNESGPSCVSPEDEVSQIAEFLGYAINENEMDMPLDGLVGNTETELHNPHASGTSAQSTASVQPISSVYHLVPLSSFIPMASQVQWIVNGTNPADPVISAGILEGRNIPEIDRSDPVLHTAVNNVSYTQYNAPTSLISVDSLCSRSLPDLTPNGTNEYFSTDQTFAASAVLNQQSVTDSTQPTYPAEWTSHPSLVSDMNLVHPLTNARPSYSPLECYSGLNRAMKIDNSTVCIRQTPGASILSTNEFVPDLHSNFSHISPILRPSSVSLNTEGSNNQTTSEVAAARDQTVNRCSTCRKRTGPARGFSCRCERWFCTKHHHPEDHGCDFNFKTLLTKRSPVISDA